MCVCVCAHVPVLMSLCTHSLRHSVTPSSLPHSLPHSVTPSLTPSLPPSLRHSLPHSVTPSLPPSLSHSLTPSLPHSLRHSLRHSLLTLSLPHSLLHSLTSLLTPCQQLTTEGREIIVGKTVSGRFGFSISSLGDLDSDGYDGMCVCCTYVCALLFKCYTHILNVSVMFLFVCMYLRTYLTLPHPSPSLRGGNQCPWWRWGIRHCLHILRTTRFHHSCAHADHNR